MHPRSPLHETLRQSTIKAHHRLDHHPALMPLVRSGLSTTHYTNVLQTLYGFVAPLEKEIAAALLHFKPEVATFWQGRAGLLAEDLQALGATAVPPPEKNCLKINSLETLIGFLYTLEGSTQGGQIIAREITTHSNGQLPVRYFSCDHGEAQSRWQKFWQFAESCHPNPEASSNAAQDLFEHIKTAFDAMIDQTPTK